MSPPPEVRATFLQRDEQEYKVRLKEQAMSMGKYGVRLKEQLQWCGHLAWVCTHVHPVFFPKKIEVNTHNIVYT